MPWSRRSGISFLKLDSLRSTDACAASPRADAALGEATHTSRAAVPPWDSSGREDISRPGLRCCEPSGINRTAWVCGFQPTQDGVKTCVVSSCGFGSVASLSVFQLWVQKGTTQSVLAKTYPRSVAKSFLHVGDVVVRRQDTSRTRIQVVEPFVAHMRVKPLSSLTILRSGTGMF